MRHAKSSWGEPELDDHERPLSKRGAKAAPLIGAYMADKGWRPDIVLCSDSVRTRATLALVLRELRPPSPEISYEDILYLAPPGSLLNRVKRIEAGARCAMLVGHNPGMHALSLALVGEGKRKSLKAMAMKFPTAALAVMTFSTKTWSDIVPAQGVLEDFIVPRDLA